MENRAREPGRGVVKPFGKDGSACLEGGAILCLPDGNDSSSESKAEDRPSMCTCSSHPKPFLDYLVASQAAESGRGHCCACASTVLGGFSAASSSPGVAVCAWGCPLRVGSEADACCAGTGTFGCCMSPSVGTGVG